MSVISSTYVMPFSHYYVSQLAAQILSGSGQRGTTLEQLVGYLMRTIPGLQPVNRVLGKGGEIDLLIRNVGPPGQPLKWFGDYFLVECKDQREPVSEKEFGHFLTKMILNKTIQGAIVSRRGLSGSPGYTYASRDQKLAYSQLGLVVLNIILTDLQNLRSVQEFLMLLQSKYERIRFS